MSDFDPKTLTPKDLKNVPIEVLKTELPNLAKALGVSTAELFRAMSGAVPTTEIGPPGQPRDIPTEQCCHSDNW